MHAQLGKGAHKGTGTLRIWYKMLTVTSCIPRFGGAIPIRIIDRRGLIMRLEGRWILWWGHKILRSIPFSAKHTWLVIM